ncbi:hypothetical protein BGZ81_002098 [Podila clonocystis]|nr:hypothetical protein BGZ81_002098 [Podila clonocystis]
MADESFVLVGTPFPQIKKTDEFGDPKRPNPTKDLEVRDEQGRRRFHGAFTGGYSAGYFNTVGSKEGWAPSEFVSSRDKRSERKMNRPEDFMDEEDKQMMKESSRLMTTEDFDTLGSTRKELEQKRAAARNMQLTGGALGVLPDKIIDDLIVPSSEPVGIRLLKRMGWKPGQGIGPRVTKKQKLPQNTTLSEDEDDTPANITFAPIDSAIVVFTNKSNVHGLGFDPYKYAPEFDTRQQTQSRSKYLSGTGAGPKTGLGFGTFDDDEDDDIYGPAGETAPMYCSDGRPPLQGFVLASTSTKTPKWYSAPKVPANFVPHHVFPEDIKPAPPPLRRHQQPQLTADDRAMVLGETPIDAPRRSVFEYISAENKNRLDSILGMVLDTEGDKTLKKDYFEVPKIEQSSAEAALKGFMPFGDNIAKQSRYKQYLNIQAGLSNETITLVEGFSGADMTKELNEFVQAARIFKPLSSTMSSRFTTASNVIEFAQPAAGLRSAADIKASAADKSSPMHAVVEKMEVPKSQAAKAAAMGMFGPLTRTTVEFYPSKLLCKRFNVPNPHPDHKDTGPEAAKDLLDKTTMDSMMMNRRPGEGMAGDDQISSVSTPIPNESEIAESVELQTETQETKEAEEVLERPPMDIFKAIFDDSDSDEDDDSDSETTSEKAKGLAQIEVEHMSAPVTEQEPEGPFRPVFTRKSERGLDAGPTRGGISLKKFDISHQDENENENENEFGPKLSISKPMSDRRNKPESISGSKSKGSRSRRKRDVDSENEREAREISKGTGLISLSEGTGVSTSQSPNDAFKVLTIEEKEETNRSESRKTSRRSPSPDPPSSTRSGSREESSKKHKSSHPSSSSKPESSRHRSSHSSSRNRSSSRSRRRDFDSKDSRGRDDDKEKSRHSESNRTKRHREHRSRSRSPKRSSRDKDRERDDSRRRHGKSSKSSRSDRDGDKYSSSSNSSRREKTKDSYVNESDDDIWVEKHVEIPVSTAQSSSIPARAPISHRPRASEFF